MIVLQHQAGSHPIPHNSHSASQELGNKNLSRWLERRHCCSQSLPHLQMTQVWFSAPQEGSSQLSVAPAPWDPTSPSYLQGHTHAYGKYTQKHGMHINKLVGVGGSSQALQFQGIGHLWLLRQRHSHAHPYPHPHICKYA